MTPGPPTRETLEELSDRSMPGFERAVLGAWTLRAAAGATGRANTVWPAGDPGTDIRDAADRVEAWYLERDLRPGYQVFEGADSRLVAVLDERGYERQPGALAMWARLGELDFGPGDARERNGWEQEVHYAPPDDFASLIADPPRVQEIAASALTHIFVTMYDESGDLLGGGKAAIDGRHVGIFAVLTDPSARRRGVATAVMVRLLSEARSRGADSAWLQVMAENEPARRMYERAGFVTLHNYEYRFAPA